MGELLPHLVINKIKSYNILPLKGKISQLFDMLIDKNQKQRLLFYTPSSDGTLILNQRLKHFFDLFDDYQYNPNCDVFDETIIFSFVTQNLEDFFF
jgi:hypothetical protein